MWTELSESQLIHDSRQLPHTATHISRPLPPFHLLNDLRVQPQLKAQPMSYL